MAMVLPADELKTADRDAHNTIDREYTQLTCPKCGHIGKLLHTAGDATHVHDTVTNFIQMPCSGIPPHRILVCPKCNAVLDPLDPQGRAHKRRNNDA